MLIQKWKLDPVMWLVIKDEPKQLTLVHRYSDKSIRVIPKENGGNT
jgi:hypothetical protein